MAYTWQAETVPGSEVQPDELAAVGVGRAFDDQMDAEAWLSDSYAELADLGVESVSLFEEDRLVYGPMSLSAE